MIATDQQAEEERASAEAIIAATASFPGVESIRVELGEDHTGDPSMWLVFSLQRDPPTDDAWFQGFSDYSTKLGLKIIHSGITRFPYSRLETAA